MATAKGRVAGAVRDFAAAHTAAVAPTAEEQAVACRRFAPEPPAAEALRLLPLRPMLAAVWPLLPDDAVRAFVADFGGRADLPRAPVGGDEDCAPIVAAAEAARAGTAEGVPAELVAAVGVHPARLLPPGAPPAAVAALALALVGLPAAFRRNDGARRTMCRALRATAFLLLLAPRLPAVRGLAEAVVRAGGSVPRTMLALVYFVMAAWPDAGAAELSDVVSALGTMDRRGVGRGN